MRTRPLCCLKTTHFIAKKTPLWGYLLLRIRHRIKSILKRSVDEDYSLWVLLHQTTDAVAKARQKELNQSGISFIAEEESIWSCQTSPVLPQVGSKKTDGNIDRVRSKA